MNGAERLKFSSKLWACKQKKRNYLRFSVKKLFLEILQNSQENTCAKVSFLIKLQVSACNFVKNGTLVQVFFYEFCKTFKNNYFIEHLRTTASNKKSKLIFTISTDIIFLKMKPNQFR